MKDLEFLEYSKLNRESFLDIVSNLMEMDMEFISRNEVFFFLKELFEKYTNYLHTILENYNEKYSLDIKFEDVVYDFVSTMEPQIIDPGFITKDEYTNHLCCVIYNMIINIHKYSYEIFSKNNELNEKAFFHGTSLSELLEKNEITIEQFRQESYYDIDNFNHIDLINDTKYLISTNMIDIYLLTILSDVVEVKEYLNFYDIMYALNYKKLISKPLFRFLITMEDAIKMKRSYAKGIIYTLVACLMILSLGILFAVKILQ